MAQGTWREDPEENAKLQKKLREQNNTDLGNLGNISHEEHQSLLGMEPEKQMSGLKPTWQDQQWYEQQKEKERAQQFAGQTGIVGDTLMTLGGFAHNVVEDNKDSQLGQFIGNMLQGLGHADYMAKKQAYEMHGPTGPQALGALEAADTVLSLGGSAVLRNAPRLAREAAEAGARDIKSLGVGQATLATLQEGIDRIPPMGPQLQVSLAGIPNTNEFVRQRMVDLQPPTVMQITLKDPANIPKGVRQGSAQYDPVFAPQVEEFFKKREKLRQQYIEMGRRRSSKLPDKLKQIYNDVSTGPSRNPLDDPEAYRGDSTAKKFDQYRKQSEAEPIYLEGKNKGKIKFKQQHHLFSKQESHAFVERMIELGDEDDVLALFIMAEDMDATMGGRLSNMLNMEDVPHNIGHQSRIFDGREVKSNKMKELVQQAKTTDELMDMFRKYVTENVKPSMDEARALEKLYKKLKFNNDAINMLRDKNMRS